MGLRADRNDGRSRSHLHRRRGNVVGDGMCGLADTKTGAHRVRELLRSVVRFHGDDHSSFGHVAATGHRYGGGS